MSTSAIIMMIISMLIVWGGLVAAVLRLRNHPQLEDELPPGTHRAE
ncbi:methionine/alanine import family NSS transporter small subunit [Streptomyces filamentosus]|uniref:Methionine/alanine import family NSS transporter small subunit n=2 Tax=Streptomyces filamentosus TaxID=67294 RepID=A0ABY4UT30_STRFL|nr:MULTISPECIES: methionine/alanine import family NSS transporter small subunit [Streptomyces]EFE77066.1 predicted protein [Streptomyces filamentosus NRRL 15998]ESU48280.1 hypothetical protein P376_3738 [Streptomyces sp. HCCB10043]MYR81025.1 methionine/alanine import family NSS transporter small subunit [Streptomyces sp. SID5466]USC47485.1 methionine/alanine import family NSS transporter small subunit [Streptomyces filamentosus]